LEASLGGKWLELLSEIAPALKRASIMFDRGKWLELLSEIAPALKRASIMFDPDDPLSSAFMSTRAVAVPLEPDPAKKAGRGCAHRPPILFGFRRVWLDQSCLPPMRPPSGLLRGPGILHQWLSSLPSKPSKPGFAGFEGADP
jgi:hypothetical protein